MIDEKVKEYIDCHFSAMNERLKKPWFKFHQQIPTHLFHYTNDVGLQGILSSNRLWATNISFLNDASELIYACDLVNVTLEECMEKYDSNIVKEFLGRSMKTFNAFDGFYDAYVFCFCEDDDLLSQWRAYGTRGGGYAIGIQSKFIGMRTPLANPVDFLLRKIIYKPEEQKNLIEKLILELSDLLCDVAKMYGEEGGNEAIPHFCHSLRDQIAEYLICFKSPAFKEEKEWRVIYVSALLEGLDRIEFRASRGNIVPYVELDISPSVGVNSNKIPIGKIVHGPTLHPVITKKSLNLYLRKLGYAFVGVLGSNIPLRA